MEFEIIEIQCVGEPSLLKSFLCLTDRRKGGFQDTSVTDTRIDYELSQTDPNTGRGGGRKQITATVDLLHFSN